MVEGQSPSLEQGSLPRLVRHPSKESKAEETRKKGKMITKNRSLRGKRLIWNYLVLGAFERVALIRIGTNLGGGETGSKYMQS